jgi:hypothetical protein
MFSNSKEYKEVKIMDSIRKDEFNTSLFPGASEETNPPNISDETNDKVTFSFDDIDFESDLFESRSNHEQETEQPSQELQVSTDQNQTDQGPSFASETDLIQHAQEIMYKADVTILLSYWEIGRSINSFYKGKYGSKQLQRIADATGVGKDTLAKMCGFAKKYSQEQIQVLLESDIPIPWNRIAQNLSIPADQFIETLQKSETPDQFYNGIINLKNPDEKRGKSRLPGRVEPEVIDVQPIQSAQPEIVELDDMGDTDMPIPEDYPVADDMDQEEINEQYRAHERGLQDLKDEVARLTSELIKRDMRIKTLEIDLAKANKDLDQQYDRADRAEKKIAGVIQICEKGGGPQHIMEWLDMDD